jgi:putative membrane protein
MALALAAAPVYSQVVAPGTSPRQGADTTTTTTTTPKTTSTPQPTAAATTVQAEFRNDMPFIEEAASANLMEIRLGQLAQSKASNQAVKQFGQRMVTDHTRLEQQLTSTLSRNRIGFNAALNSQHQAKVSQVQNLSGQPFDSAYMTMMIQDHQTDAAKFEDRSRNADSPQIRELAARSLPILQQHLTLARQVGGQVNAQTTTIAAADTAFDTTNTATPNSAANRANQANRRNIKADTYFIRENVQDNYLEVSLGRLAERKAQNSAVKQFAQRQVTDHSRFQDQWTRLASQNGLPAQQGMGGKHRDKLQKLEKLSGREFDREYMTMQIQNHKDYIDYLEKEGRSAKSGAVRQLADRELPTLHEHFDEAKRIGARVGADTDVTLRSDKKSKNK